MFENCVVQPSRIENRGVHPDILSVHFRSEFFLTDFYILAQEFIRRINLTQLWSHINLTILKNVFKYLCMQFLKFKNSWSLTRIF